jgi:hypothetical protein
MGRSWNPKKLGWRGEGPGCSVRVAFGPRRQAIHRRGNGAFPIEPVAELGAEPGACSLGGGERFYAVSLPRLGDYFSLHGSGRPGAEAAFLKCNANPKRKPKK